MEKRITILDSTLRDGTQGMGVTYSTTDKISIITLLDNLGVDYIEIGNPVSNPKDADIFLQAKGIKLKHAKLAAFGSTRRKNSVTEEDASLLALIKAETDACVLFGKCSMFHVNFDLEATPEKI